MKAMNLLNRLMIGLLLTLTALPMSGKADSGQESRYAVDTVKAVFLERIANFVTWPDSADMVGHNTPFVIGIIGNSPLSKAIIDIYNEKHIRDRQVKILQDINLEDINKCHMVYIAFSERDRLPAIVSLAEKFPVLTLADSEGFGAQGVHINFYVVDKKVRFEINEKTAKKSSLIFSHHLYKVARIIPSPEAK